MRVSANYLTAPQGSSVPQPDYVNAVAMLETALAPRALLDRLQRIERLHRRKRPRERNAPRTLDLDLLLFGGRRLRAKDLSIPHPRMHVRAFVLRPLADMAPAARIPGHGAGQAAAAPRFRTAGRADPRASTAWLNQWTSTSAGMW